MKSRLISVSVLTLAAAFATACHKKVAAVHPPPPPAQSAAATAANRPTIALFAADPNAINRGSSTTLRWSVRDATDVSITPAIGAVNENGSREISPSDDTTYTLTAKGPGGNADATTTVTLRAVASNMPDADTRARIQDLLNRIQDAYFDYNKHILRSDAETALQADAKTLADILRQYPDYKLTVEGNADERGSEEYNMALGDARAKAAREYLITLGVPADQLLTMSYGKDHPVCTEHDEACWQKNRRAHVTQEVAQNH